MVTTIASIQAKRPPPPLIENRFKYTNFFHPGYVHSNFLFNLARGDQVVTQNNADNKSREDPNTGVPTRSYGVHHGTALVACQILAGNKFTGSYLSLDREGQRRVQEPLDGILTADGYYFIVENEPRYPITPTFQDWEFPSTLPSWWHTTPANRPRSTCYITNANYAVEEAHLVPKEELEWYFENSMNLLAKAPDTIDDKRNLIRLRKDLHFAFDNRWWAIVPKMVTTGPGSEPSREYVMHVIGQEGTELWTTYHNTIVEFTHDQRDFLFARFAWAIHLRHKAFILWGGKRSITRAIRDEGGHLIGFEVVDQTGEELREAYGISEPSDDSDTEMSDMEV